MSVIELLRGDHCCGLRQGQRQEPEFIRHLSGLAGAGPAGAVGQERQCFILGEHATCTATPSPDATCSVLVITTWESPAAGRKWRSPFTSVTLSKTTRHRFPSASSQCRTAAPVASRSSPGPDKQAGRDLG